MSETEWGVFEVARYRMLDVWMALGGDSRDFDRWLDDEPRRSPADAWSELLGAIRGDPMTDVPKPPVATSIPPPIPRGVLGHQLVWALGLCSCTQMPTRDRPGGDMRAGERRPGGNRNR